MSAPVRVSESWTDAAARFATMADRLAREGRKEDAHFAMLHVGYCMFFARAMSPAKPAQGSLKLEIGP